MKKAIFLFFMVLMLGIGFNPILAQWTQQPSGTTYDLQAVSFVNQNTGLAVGSYGVILKTINGGNNWTERNSGQTWNLLSVRFLDNAVIVAGDLGIVLISTNLGDNWVTITTPTSELLLDINFVNQSTGYTCGANFTLLKTINGGLNWTIQGNPGLGGHYSSCNFFNGETGVIAQYPNSIKRTTNSGNNWTAVYTPQDTPWKFAFLSSNTGVAFGDAGSICKTTNAGMNWSLVQGTTGNSGYGIFDGCFLDQNFGYAVGRMNISQEGIIINSTNWGNSWSIETTLANALYGFGFNSTHLYAVGANGSIYRANNPVGITPIGSIIPDKYNLSQNYPNPFNPSTNIEFSIPKNGNVKLSVFDITGKELTVLVNQALRVGTYKVDFNGNDLSSGTYFYKIQSIDFTSVKKMVLIK